MKITALVTPFQPDAKLPTAIGPRVFDAVDEFALAIGNAAGIGVPIVEGSLSDAPDDGYVLLFEEPSKTEMLLIGPRVILINADRSSVRSMLERDRLACAVEKHRYFTWRTQRSEETGDGLYGRKEVALRMGATIAAGPPPTEHYGLLSSATQRDLPSLIARYLDIYEMLQGGKGLS